MSENNVQTKTELTENKKTSLNFIATMITFVINFGLSFFLTPYIVEKCGNAYGFVGLANQFISYATIFTAALNSMTARFVTIALRRNEIDKASKYFKTIFISDLIISLVLFVPMALVIVFLPSLFNIDSAIVGEVRLLWIFLFSGFLISLIGSIFSVVYFATNRLYLSQRKQLGNNLIRFGVIILCFAVFEPTVAFLGMGTLAGGLYTVLFNIRHTKKLLPQVQFYSSKFDKTLLKEVLSSGAWNSFSALSNILLGGLDLLLVNLCVQNGDDLMTTLAIAKTIVSLVQSFFGTISSVFVPNLTNAYAKDDYGQMKSQINMSIRCLRLFACIPAVFLILYSKDFFALYVPTQNAEMLSYLAIISSLAIIFISPFSGFDSVFIVVNKMKIYSFSILIAGILSVGTMFVLLNVVGEAYKVYVICGASVFFIVLKGLTFLPIMVAKFTKQKWWAFYPQILWHVLSLALLTGICYFIRYIFVANSWFKLIVALGIIAVVCILFNFFVVLKKSDRKFILGWIKKIFVRKKKAVSTAVETNENSENKGE